MKTKIIEIKNISVSYGKHIVLEDVSFDIYNTDFIAVVGPNGSGKTTLIHAILKKLKVKKGEVVYCTKISFLAMFHRFFRLVCMKLYRWDYTINSSF